MNKLSRILVAASLALGLGAGAWAAGQGANEPCGAPQGWQHEHGPKNAQQFRERMEKRAAELHDKLKLNGSQEPAWQAFTAAMRPAEHGARPARSDWANLSAPDRMQKMLELMKQHEAQMAQRVDAMKTFYATLTPEQQKVFNDNVGMHHHHDRAAH